MAYISRFKQDFDDMVYLGKGGYGIVMKARNKIDGQYYAIKRVKLPSRQAGRDKAQKEAIALTTLNHPNIVRYFNAWEESPPPGFQETEDDKIIPTDVSSLPSATDSASLEAGTLSTEQSTRDDDFSITFEKSSSSTSFSDAIVTASTPSSPTPPSSSSSSTEGSSNQNYTTNGTTSLESSISEKEATKSVAQTTYLYIQMELCKTETLADWLKKYPERRGTTCVEIIHQIATGLQHIHKLGFIHRDLSPSNIFFSLDNVVKIGDFGLVTSIIDESEAMANVEADDNVNGVGNGVSCHAEAVGRALYRSREQRDGLTYNIKTDIFALGIINFELLYPMDTLMERVKVLRKVKEGQFPEDFDFNETNADLVRQLLDADPKKRPDAAQFLNLLNTQGASKLSTRKNPTGPIESSIRATEKSAGTRERSPGAVVRSPGARERSPGTNERSTGTRERSYGIKEWSPERKHHSAKITRPIDILRMNHLFLKKTVSTRHITGYLFENGTLTIDDVDRINNQATEEDKMETLLFILPRKGEGAFQTFCSALKEKRDGVSPYVAEKLESTLLLGDENEGQQEASSEVRDYDARWDLLRKHRLDISTGLDTEKTCLHLINSDVLTEMEYNRIKREETPPERTQKLLSILPTKGPRAFHVFWEALKQQGRDDLAALLIREPVRVSNVGNAVSYFFYSEDAKRVKQAMEGRQYVIVLSGITGSGKTQLALWQAQLFMERYPTAVVWRLNGHDKKTFLTDKENLLRALKEKVPTDDSQVDACVAKALDNRSTPVLLIMDDLDDGVILSPALLRPREEWKILLITHRKRLQQSTYVSIPDDSYLTINGFLQDEAVDFLRVKLHQHTSDELQRLTSMFGGLPLGLAEARNYLYHKKISVENYLNLLEKRETASKLREEAKKCMWTFYGKPELQQTHSLTQSQQADRNIFAGLSLAISKLDYQAKSMFQLTGYMDKSQIPLVILKEDVNDSPLMRNMALDDLVMQVEDLSLGKVDGIGNDRLLSVHEVTQLAVRLSLTHEQEKERLEKLEDILLKYFVQDNRYSRSGKLAELLQPHVGKVLQFVEEASDDVSFSLALARLSEVYGLMKTQCGMPGNAEEHLRAAKDHIEQLAGIDWREVNLPVAERLDSGFHSYEEHGGIEEQNVKEAGALYSKLYAASKRLPDELFTTMIQSRVIAKQDLALFSALGKAPADLYESVTKKEPLTPAQYQNMVENGIALPIERMKEVYLPELYASISYSLGRCFFYMKEKYANDQAGKDDLIRNMRLAYYVCDQIKNHTGISVLHKYLSESNALLYLRLEEEGKSQDELRRDIKFAIERFSVFLEEEGEYFEFGILKKSSQDSYSLMMCHRQLVKCFNLLLKHADSEDERQACIYQAQKKCEKMIEHAEKQVERDAYGNIVERPEQLAAVYNTAGKFLTDDGDSAKLKEALDWFQKAYDLEKEKENYSLSDTLFGLAEGLVRRNQGDDVEKAECYISELLELYNRKWSGKKDEIEKARKIQAQITQLIEDVSH